MKTTIEIDRSTVERLDDLIELFETETNKTSSYDQMITGLLNTYRFGSR